MIYSGVIFVATALLSLALLMLKKPFFNLALSSVGMLDTMVDVQMDEMEKHRLLIKRLGRLLKSLSMFIFGILLALGIAFLPVYGYALYTGIELGALDTSSWYFFIPLILGSVVLFVVPQKGGKSAYSDWSMLLHRMILDHYNVSKGLFRLDKRFFGKELERKNEFVVITGLARAGTTALTTQLHSKGPFYSLSYANMPFLLAVNIWRKVYRPKKQELRERTHGDRVMFGLNTVEALEEYFFKAFTGDAFYQNDGLVQHDIDDQTYERYLDYQALIGLKQEGSTYLAKNNNFILRYPALRARNKDFKVIMMFRHPLDHANSLMKQHGRFCQLQQEDPFALEYMNWLGHHEFGLNHLMFNFGNESFKSSFDPSSINYWLENWCNYYDHVLQLDADPHLFLVEYEDFADRPTALMDFVKKQLGQEWGHGELQSFKKSELGEFDTDPEVMARCLSIHAQLIERKAQF